MDASACVMRLPKGLRSMIYDCRDLGFWVSQYNHIHNETILTDPDLLSLHNSHRYNSGYGMNDSQLFHVIHEIISSILWLDVFNSAELENLLLVVWF